MRQWVILFKHIFWDDALNGKEFQSRLFSMEFSDDILRSSLVRLQTVTWISLWFDWIYPHLDLLLFSTPSVDAEFVLFESLRFMTQSCIKARKHASIWTSFRHSEPFAAVVKQLTNEAENVLSLIIVVAKCRNLYSYDSQLLLTRSWLRQTVHY